MTHQSPVASDTPFIPAQPLSATLPAIIEQLPPDSDHPPQTQFTRARQRAFLQLLADSGEVRVAARASAVSHQTVYRLRRSCLAFRTGWDAALLVARERAEEELATRALHGVEEEVFYHGEVVAKRRRYDSRLLLAHLARLDRLADRADVAAMAGAFDDVLEAFAQAGEEGEVELPDVAPSELAETPSGPCNMRSMSSAMSPEGEGVEDPFDAEEAEQDFEWVDDDPEVLRAMKARLRAMRAARPEGAKAPHELATEGCETSAIELAQLIAFEAGEVLWWEAMPDADPATGQSAPIGQDASDGVCSPALEGGHDEHMAHSDTDDGRRGGAGGAGKSGVSGADGLHQDPRHPGREPAEGGLGRAASGLSGDHDGARE